MELETANGKVKSALKTLHEGTGTQCTKTDHNNWVRCQKVMNILCQFTDIVSLHQMRIFSIFSKTLHHHDIVDKDGLQQTLAPWYSSTPAQQIGWQPGNKDGSAHGVGDIAVAFENSEGHQEVRFV